MSWAKYYNCLSSRLTLGLVTTSLIPVNEYYTEHELFLISLTIHYYFHIKMRKLVENLSHFTFFGCDSKLLFINFYFIKFMRSEDLPASKSQVALH